MPHEISNRKEIECIFYGVDDVSFSPCLFDLYNCRQAKFNSSARLDGTAILVTGGSLSTSDNSTPQVILEDDGTLSVFAERLIHAILQPEDDVIIDFQFRSHVNEDWLRATRETVRCVAEARNPNCSHPGDASNNHVTYRGRGKSVASPGLLQSVRPCSGPLIYVSQTPEDGGTVWTDMSAVQASWDYFFSMLPHDPEAARWSLCDYKMVISFGGPDGGSIFIHTRKPLELNIGKVIASLAKKERLAVIDAGALTPSAEDEESLAEFRSWDVCKPLPNNWRRVL